VPTLGVRVTHAGISISRFSNNVWLHMGNDTR